MGWETTYKLIKIRNVIVTKNTCKVTLGPLHSSILLQPVKKKWDITMYHYGPTMEITAILIYVSTNPKMLISNWNMSETCRAFGLGTPSSRLSSCKTVRTTWWLWMMMDYNGDDDDDDDGRQIWNKYLTKNWQGYINMQYICKKKPGKDRWPSLQPSCWRQQGRCAPCKQFIAMNYNPRVSKKTNQGSVTFQSKKYEIFCFNSTPCSQATISVVQSVSGLNLRILSHFLDLLCA